jgi:hypothetical protein
VEPVRGSRLGPVPRSVSRSALIFVGVVLGGHTMDPPRLGPPDDILAGRGGRPGVGHAVLGSVAVRSQPADLPLFTTRLEYPGGVDLTWNPSVPLLVLVSWPAELIGGAVLQYNVVLTVGLAANVWAGCLA